jgi:EVE domain
MDESNPCNARAMATNSPAVTRKTLGAWLIKGSRDVYPVDKLIRTRFSTVTGWSLRETYRTGLIKPGQPVLFWISGASKTHPAGLYAQGHTTGRATADVADDEWEDPAERGEPKLFMPVELRPLAAPVLRSDLLQHPSLSQIEVLKMAAGSNPSFVTPADLAALHSGWRQVTVK